MGFKLLPIDQDDEDIYDIIPINSPTRWTPSKYLNHKDLNAYPYDPSDHTHVEEEGSYPNQVNHLSNIHQDIDEKNFNFNTMDPELPLVNTQVLATIRWHRVIYEDIDPRHLRQFLGWRPTQVVTATLRRTTQLARMIIRHPMRRHLKERFPHMNIFRIDEPVSTDPIFSNCRSIYHGYTIAQVFYGVKSHTIFVYGVKSKGEFPTVYRDFI